MPSLRPLTLCLLVFSTLLAHSFAQMRGGTHTHTHTLSLSLSTHTHKHTIHTRELLCCGSATIPYECCLTRSSLAPLANTGIIKVNPKNNRLLDEDGRERIFHGTNVVYKAPPYVPKVDSFDFQYSYCEEDYKNLQVELRQLNVALSHWFFLLSLTQSLGCYLLLFKAWGVNAVRLGVMWPGVEPTRGQYNETYLGILLYFSPCLSFCFLFPVTNKIPSFFLQFQR